DAPTVRRHMIACAPHLATADRYAREPYWIVRRQMLTSRPDLLSAALILSEPNATDRRTMIEEYGVEWFLREAGAELRHADDTGKLWRIRFRRPGLWGRLGFTDDEPIQMVEVVNSTQR